MRFNKLDLNLLVALDTLFTIRNVSRAADHLNMSQSALSSALARLREYFDDELLVPVGRRMDLTPKAEMLREAVRDVLVRIETTITAPPDFTMAVLTPYLVALARERAPNVRFQFLQQRDEPRRALEQGDADLLVVPQDYCSAAHPLETLFEEQFTCVVWEGSVHAREGLTMAQYLAAGHVVMRPGDVAQQSFEASSMDSTGIERRVDVSTYSFLAAPFQVLGTDRITTVHGRLARQLSHGLPIRILPAPFPVRPMAQAMQWHKYRSMDPGMIWLRGMLHEAVLRMDAHLQ
jgi:DNA-binding transcriptional LysR family regulator